ncbi:MAG TPA: hypothetical protein VNA57_02130 [Acidimicrobiales bacterium]|nr:hypothetical protein [Acidimicrobiales bacterium]
MSFPGNAYGGVLDYGHLLPRRVRKWVWRGLLALAFFSPTTFLALNTEYSTRAVGDVLTRLEPLLTPSTTSTRAP